LVLLDSSRTVSGLAERVTARLAPAGIATSTADRQEAAGLAPGAVLVVCGSAQASPVEVRAVVEQARARGAALTVQAEEVIADDLDVLAFGGQILAALGVA
jgi:hypothetical protein